MCVSMIGQLLFAVTMFLALALTAVATFTPGWRLFTVATGHEQEAEKFSVPAMMGLFWCTSPTPENNGKIDYCHLWWKDKPEWEKIMTALMIIALGLEIGSLIWVSITFCACCCREFWILFLPLTALLTTVSLTVALFLYAQNIDSTFDILGGSKSGAQEAYNVRCFYSYYLACGAVFLAAIDILIGAFAKKLAQICC